MLALALHSHKHRHQPPVPPSPASPLPSMMTLRELPEVTVTSCMNVLRSSNLDGRRAGTGRVRTGALRPFSAPRSSPPCRQQPDRRSVVRPCIAPHAPRQAHRLSTQSRLSSMVNGWWPLRESGQRGLTRGAVTPALTSAGDRAGGWQGRASSAGVRVVLGRWMDRQRPPHTLCMIGTSTAQTLAAGSQRTQHRGAVPPREEDSVVGVQDGDLQSAAACL